MGDWAGKHLGNYHLLHLLGEGGFAEVYLGEHMHLGTQAAIKVLSTKLQREEVERFRQEARTIAGLRHPSIVRVLDFGVEGSVPYLVMDYAAGGTLRQCHPRGTRLEPAALLPYVRQVASALQYAHERSLIHRDVKPENMLIGEQGEILLSDFGIALVAQSSRYQGTQEVAGTVAYMAPEQVQGKPRTASDQYALGIVVYEWLAGERPFHGSFTEIAAQQVMTPPPPLRAKLPDLSLAVERVVLTALEKDPQARFTSVRALATALEQACQMQGVFFAPTQRGSGPAPVVFPGVDVPPASPLPSTIVVPPASPMIEQAAGAFPPPVPPPMPAPQMPSGPAGGISRRSVLFGTGALVGVAVVGGGLWLASARGGVGRSPTSPSTSPPTPPYTYLYSGHSDKVFAVAWSPGGTRIASGSFDRTVQVWDAAHGGNVFIYRGYASAVYALVWSPDGTRIASGGEAHTVQVWDAPDGNHVFTYDGHSQVVNTLAWSPDSTRIASASDDKTVRVWDALSGVKHDYNIYRGHAEPVTAVAWSPSSQYIASGSLDHTVRMWDADGGGNDNIYRGHTMGVNTLAWSPDARFYIASAGFDSTVQVWYAFDGHAVYTYRGHSGNVHAVAWSPDGSRIASASSDNTVQVWGAVNGDHVFTYRGHSDTVWAVAWSPDGNYIASASLDKTVQVWQAP